MKAAVDNQEKLWNKYFILFCIGATTVGVAMQMMNTVIPLYVQELGGSASFTGVTLSGMAIAALATRFLVGGLSDRKSRRVMMLIGLVGFAIASFLFSLFPFLVAIIICRMLQGSSYAVFSNTNAAAVADVLPPKRMGEGIGYFGLGSSLSAALGPSIALLIVADGQYSRLFIFAVVMIFITGIFIYFCNYEKKQRKNVGEATVETVTEELPLSKQEKGLWKFIEKRSLSPATVELCFAFSSSAVVSFLVLFAKAQGITNPGMFFTIQAVAMVAARLFVGRVADRRGNLLVIIPSSLLIALTFIILAFFVNDWSFLVAGALYGLGMGSCQPTINAIAMKVAPAHRRGAASTTYFLTKDIGFSIGSTFWGVILDNFGYMTMFTGALLFVLLGIGLSITLLRVY